MQNRTSHHHLAGVLVVSVLLASAAARVEAAEGDCAQPSTAGMAPTATDCLYILKTAVGSATCSPECVCAPKGTLPTTATDALICLRYAVGQPVTLSCPCASVPDGDDFDDDTKDPAKWGDDEVTGDGVLTETGHVLEYTCSPGTPYDEIFRPWIASVFPAAADWDVRIDIVNVSLPSQNDQVDSYGLRILNTSDPSDEIYAEMYASHLGGPPTRSGFYGYLGTDGNYVHEVDTDDLGLSTGALRIAYDAATKVLTLAYDTDPTNGYDWQPYASFGLGGAGGDDATTDWMLSAGDRFDVAVYGYSSNMDVVGGKVYGDNFFASGGVTP